MTSIFSSALSQWQDGRDYMYCDLVDAVKSVHQQSFRTAVKAVNQYATMRNWLIGFFIVEYQQKGKDRAAYGENLLKSLEQSLQIRGLNVTLFQNSRLFYSLYPQVGNLFMIKIQPTPSVKSVAEEIQPTASAKLQSDAETIVGKLSFSHLCELIHIGDETTRLFYETECVKCGWSVRELRRFIATNLHIRVGMSQNPNAVIASLPSNNNMSALDIRQPYTFEFLGLKATEVLKESDIEEALLSHLQQFLLEMGKGFCFEDRQKRMIIDDEYYYADWAFCYVQRRVKRWLNMPSLAWITICLFQPTFCNCQINRCWRNLSKIIKVKQFEKFCMIQDMTHNMYKDIVRMTAMTARIVLTGLILLLTGGNARAGVVVTGNVYGGGNKGIVEGSATVNIVEQ